mmetsp:Transcript_36942/g.56574  ORF Transcript_36942/g.56574 Transcript_36942/m.56574 type:complete len:173 (+) Transcript_36942:794-1312(+)
MMACSKPYIDAGLTVKNDALFPGKACYPLSPNGSDDQDKDQLNVILNALGNLSSDDLSFVTDRDAKKYTKQFLEQDEMPINYNIEFHESDPALAQLMHKLMRFNYHFRTPAKDLIKLEMFDDVRDTELEALDSRKIILNVDKSEAFDYESCEPTTLKISDVIGSIVNECQLL